ncbi:MAG: hypothetical protein IT459_23235 [Planctomycetes bacterium]|nr:hypothetical protein [Planctomycetota bacterium]
MTTLRVDKRALFESLGYEPHAAQWEVHRSTAQIRVLCTGARFGKTTAAAFEAVAALLAPSAYTRGWIAAPTYALTEHVFGEVLDVFESLLSHRIKSYVPRTRTLTVFNLTGGTSVLEAKSCDRPTSLLGAGLDFLVVDEAAQLDRRVWDEALSARLLDKRGWALLISTPRGCNWFRSMVKRGERGVPGYESWCFPSSANPHLDPTMIEAQRGLLSPDTFAEQYEAAFVGELLEPCFVCGGPSSRVSGLVIVKHGRELPRCVECGMETDTDGKTIVALQANGVRRLKRIWFPDDGGVDPFVREVADVSAA